MSWKQLAARAATTVAVAALAVGLTTGFTSLSSPAGAATPTTPTYDGSTAAKAAASCWAIKQANPAATDGIYWLQTPQLVAPQQFYCDQTTDGGGWVLIGRGRNAWTWNVAGQGSAAAIRNTPSGTGAFAPATLSSDTVTGLLGGTRVDALQDGIRVVRSTSTDGTSTQEMRIKMSSRTTWNWTFGGGMLFSDMIINGTDYGSGNTQNWGVDSNLLSMNTMQTSLHGYQMGFGLGGNIVGQNSATSYLYSSSGEGQALPFSQVWIRPQVSNPTYPTIAASGVAASTKTPLESSKTSNTTPWGVTGNVGGYRGELTIQVQAMTQVGSTMYVGGNFQYVQKGANPGPGEKVQQSYLAGFDVNTGAWLSSFTPTLNGQVWDLQAMPNGNLLVGGEFTSVNGAAGTMALAELNPTTGAVIPGWKSYVTLAGSTDLAQVKAIDIQGNYVYLGGRFNHIYNGTTPITDSDVARVSITDGTPDGSWKPQMDGTVVELDASAQGDRVYLAGYFATINGVSSPNEGAVSTATGAAFVTGLAPWIPSTGSGSATYQQTIKEYGNYVWQGGSEHIMTQYDRTTYQPIHSFITKNGNSAGGGDSQTQVQIGNTIYYGCHCDNDYVYSNDRSYSQPIQNASDVNNVNTIVAVDATTGVVQADFDPTALDTTNGNGGWELTADSNGCLWFGGDYSQGSYLTSAYQWLGGFGKICPRDSTAPTVPSALTAKASATGVKLTWTAATDDSGVAPTYEVLRGDRVIATTTSATFTDTTPVYPAKYWVRAIDGSANRSATTAGLTVQAPAGVTQPPVAAFTDSVNGRTVSFDASTSTSTGTTITSYSWDFGDGSTPATTVAPQHTFVAAGSHTVTLTVTDSAGTQSAATQSVVANPSPPDDSYGKAVYADSPNLYYRLDDTSGTTATDTSTAGNNGTYYGNITKGVTSTVAPGDSAVTFDGASTISSGQAVVGPTVYSEEAWFNTTSTSGGKIIGFGNSNTNADSGNYDRHIIMLANGQLSLGVYPNQVVTATSPNSYNDGQWHQTVGTLGPDGLKLYVDGQLVATNTSTTTAQGYTGYWAHRW